MAEEFKPGDQRDVPGRRDFDFRNPPNNPRPPLSRDDGGGGGGGDGGGNGLMGWVIFILIFGVGNFILYMTTGIFIIPFPRR